MTWTITTPEGTLTGDGDTITADPEWLWPGDTEAWDSVARSGILTTPQAGWYERADLDTDPSALLALARALVAQIGLPITAESGDLPTTRAEMPPVPDGQYTAPSDEFSIQFANPWHDEIGRFAPKGTGKRSGPRLKLKSADKNMSQASVQKAMQKVADDVATFFGATPGETKHTDTGPYSNPGEVMIDDAVETARALDNGMILINPEFASKAGSKDYGVHEMRMIAHEAIHAYVSGSPRVYADTIGHTVEEGAAELLSINYWNQRGQPYDARDATKRPDGWPGDTRWTSTPAQHLAASVTYPEFVIETARRAASAAGGWDDRQAVFDQVEAAMRADHDGRLSFRDSTDPDFPLPDGVTNEDPYRTAQNLVLHLIEDDNLTAAAFANPWHDQIGRFAPKGTGTKFVGDAAEATQRARDAAAQDLPPEDFDGPLVHRTIALPITKEQRASIEARNQPATEAAEYNQHLHIGPELVEQALAYGGHQGMAESSGLGQHWTTKESLADSVSAPSRDSILVKFTAKPRQADIIAQEFPDGTRTGEENARGFVIGEEEVRLAPKSPVDLQDVQISYGDNQWHSVWGTDSEGFGAGLEEFERNYGPDTGFTSKRLTFANPWHDEIGRFAPKGTGSKAIGDAEADAEFEEKYGNERPSGEGDCFPAAVHYVMYDVPREERDRYRIVHGVPTGQDEIEGVRFDHAWVERTDPLPQELPAEMREQFERYGMNITVIDKSNGQDIEMPAMLYYQIGNIDIRDVKRYTFDEAAEHMLREQHYGPWT